jgi:hypothetical protein
MKDNTSYLRHGELSTPRLNHRQHGAAYRAVFLVRVGAA